MTIISNSLIVHREKNSDIGVYVGTCDSAANQVIKQVNVSENVNFVSGIQLSVTFNYENQADIPYMKVNDLPSCPIYAGTQPLYNGSLNNWKNNQVVNFILMNNIWYISSISSADVMEFKDGSLNIYNSQNKDNTMCMSLGNTELAFKHRENGVDKNIATYGLDGMRLYSSQKTIPYAQFGGTTTLGYPHWTETINGEEVKHYEPHLTANNTSLSMDDDQGQYFKVSRKGLMYKALSDSGEDKWIGINPNGNIGLIKDADISMEEENNFTPTIKDGEDAIAVQIVSSNGNIFVQNNISTTLECIVYKGTTDITDKVKNFIWKKYKNEKENDFEIIKTGLDKTLKISNNDVALKAVYVCEIEL